jgi:hypothetical protein
MEMDASAPIFASPLGGEAAAHASTLPVEQVVTHLVFGVPPDRAWDSIVFYEQIDQRPPLYLRVLLPVPIRTEGKKSEVGDEALCLYHGGHLLKRVTRVERARRFEFEVSAQALRVGGGMRLTGGHYALSELPEGRTEVELATRYLSPRRPRWLWRPLEALVCHRFHKHILRAMRRHAERAAASGEGA